MSSVDKLPNGKYRARYRTPDGRSRSRTFDKKKDADAFLAVTESSKLVGQYVDVSAGRVTFETYARQWAAAQPHRVNTQLQVESILKTHILPTFGLRPIASIQPSEVQAWVAGLDLAPSTVRTVYGKLAAIFGAAVDDHVIARSPCTSRTVRLPRLAGAEVTPMDPAEVRAVVEGVNDRYRALLLLIAGTGVRPSEATGLTVDRVDFLRRTIRIDRQLVTAANRAAVLGPVKTPSSVRTIPVPQSVLDALAVHLERYGTGEDGLIFTESNGGPIRRSPLGHMWRRTVARLNAEAARERRPPVIVDRTPHDLRHYAASVLIHQGASVKAVQKHLGHASATTTLDTYAHLWPNSDDSTRNALEAGLAQIVSSPCHAIEARG